MARGRLRQGGDDDPLGLQGLGVLDGGGPVRAADDQGGLGQRGAVLVLYAVGAVSGLFAMLVCGLSVKLALALAVVVAATALSAVILLERFPYERQNKPGIVPS